MTTAEIRKMLQEELAVPAWPVAGMALGAGRQQTYEAIKRGDIPSIRIGRTNRVSTAWLRKKLEIEALPLSTSATVEDQAA